MMPTTGAKPGPAMVGIGISNRFSGIDRRHEKPNTDRDCDTDTRYRQLWLAIF